MSEGNKTLNITYRFLSAEDFSVVHRTCLEAFSDYFIPVQLSEEQFENHTLQNAVDLNLSVGAFAEGKMVGYTLNGFGLWNGKQTVYDAGTGVIPEFRNQGIGRKMFDFLLPKLEEIGVRQILLEVIDDNRNALRLYLGLGFRHSRKLAFFEQVKNLNLKPNKAVEIREIENPDWQLFKTFWDGNPSWQFSSESIERKSSHKTILAAYLDKKCVGYGVVYPVSGIVPQIAVEKNNRRKGIGSAILEQLLTKTEKDIKLKFSNVDSSLKQVIGFIEYLEFNPTITQFEMIKLL